MPARLTRHCTGICPARCSCLMTCRLPGCVCARSASAWRGPRPGQWRERQGPRDLRHGFRPAGTHFPPRSDLPPRTPLRAPQCAWPSLSSRRPPSSNWPCPARCSARTGRNPVPAQRTGAVPDRPPARTTPPAGLRLESSHGLKTLADADLVIVPACVMGEYEPPAPPLDALRAAHAGGARGHRCARGVRPCGSRSAGAPLEDRDPT